MTYLGTRADPALDVSGISTREELELIQVERLKAALGIVLVAGMIPRRLGAVSDRELALDKKRARRVSYALEQSLLGWIKKFEILETDEMRQSGAALVWETWLPAHLTEIKEQVRWVATFSLLRDEDQWGKSSITKLENESVWIEYAMRD